MELERGADLTNGRRVVRAIAVGVFAVGLSLSGARVVGTRFEPLLIVPAVVAVAIGWLVARVSLVPRVVAHVVGFVVSGLIVAYGAGGSASDFGHGLLDGPRQVVTTTWPSPRFATIFVALAALISIVTAISVDLAMRARWRALAIAPMVVGMIVLIAVGAPDGPQWQSVLSGAAAAFTLLWIGLDDRVASIRSGSFVAVGAGLAALVTTLSVSVAVADRANPREGAAADSQLSLLDPLADIRAQVNADPPVDLYQIDSPSLPDLHFWRSSVLDIYDGDSWSTAGKLTPTGNRLGNSSGAPSMEVKVTALRTDVDLWIRPGRLLRSSIPVDTDVDRRVVGIIGTARPVTVTFTVEPYGTFDAATAGRLARIQPTEMEASFASLAGTFAGSGTINDKVGKLATELREGFKLNPTTPGGVQQSLIDTFLRDSKVGNRQQFVTGFVLLARSLGVDARVATGYEVDATTPSTVVTTREASAWPEVRAAKGWLAVDIFPEVSTAQPNDPVTAAASQTPPAPQPLDPPLVDQVDPNKPVEAPLPPHRSGTWTTVRIWAVRGGLFAGLLLWPVVVFAVIVSWKKLRRRRGLKADDPARRVSTAWTLATDALVDAGAALQTSHTNAELVAAGVRTQPAAGAPLGRLQRHADAVTFATASCDPQRAADAVDQLRLVESSIRNSSSRWWRWKWWLSTRSLRSRTQSPLR